MRCASSSAANSARRDARPWAGEVGQFQFVPSVYYKYAVDFEGNGKRDLIRRHA